MSHGLPFTKLEAAGNDFILIEQSDILRFVPDALLTTLARRICDRHLGVGGDGLVVLAHRGEQEFDLRCINPDGSRASTCGNALRGGALYIKTVYGAVTGKIIMEERACPFLVQGETVSISFTEFCFPEGPHKVHGWEAYSIHTGTEHAVVPVHDVDTIDVSSHGRQLRLAAQFAPWGANIDFVSVDGSSSIHVRTYERGVEAETLSCGTGAVAAALTCTALNYTQSGYITVRNRANVPLDVRIPNESDPPTYTRSIWVSGPVTQVFTGTYDF